MGVLVLTSSSEMNLLTAHVCDGRGPQLRRVSEVAWLAVPQGLRIVQRTAQRGRVGASAEGGGMPLPIYG